MGTVFPEPAPAGFGVAGKRDDMRSSLQETVRRMGIGIYSAYKFWLQRIFRFAFDIQYYGREHLIESGPLIVASNHVSYLDPLPLGTTFRRPLSFMARQSLFDSSKFFCWIIRNVYAFPVDRDGGTTAAIKSFCKRLDQDRAVVIFPEGTRSDDGHLQAIEPGTGMIAVRSGAPVQPVYLMGTWQCWPRGAKFFSMAPLRVYIAPAIYPRTGLGRGEKRAEQERITTELQRVLKGLEERAWAEYPKFD